MINKKITEIKANPRNPRIIKDDKFAKLVTSIKEFPEMLQKRPLICYTDVDKKFVVLGGNMRLKACIEAGLKEVPIILADDWTEEQKQEFLIKDNVSFGEWNWDDLANEWDDELLINWGLNIPKFNDVSLDEFFNEPAPENNETSSNKIILEYTDEEFQLVNEAFGKHSGSKEQVIYKLLGL